MAELGTKLGKYEIIREIARSNDIVYEAYDDATNRRIALKELQVPVGASASQAEERRQRFLREARAAGALSHPAIVTIHEVGEDAGRCFIAMEFLDGYTLRDRIDAEGFLLRDEAIRIATEIAGALAFAHRHGVIHRDVKPENIQILSDGRVKLTDFGIARLSYEPNITVDGQVFGTPAYMSPEQIAGRHLDPRTDLFSLGVVLYEMLCGQKPFGGDSVLAISVAVSTQPLKQIPGVPTAVMQVLEKALQKRPEARFHDLEEFIPFPRPRGVHSGPAWRGPVPGDARGPSVADDGRDRSGRLPPAGAAASRPPPGDVARRLRRSDSARAPSPLAVTSRCARRRRRRPDRGRFRPHIVLRAAGNEVRRGGHEVPAVAWQRPDREQGQEQRHRRSSQEWERKGPDKGCRGRERTARRTRPGRTRGRRHN